MQGWFDIPFAQRTTEERNAARETYCAALLSSREGREVLADMIRRVADQQPIACQDPSVAVGYAWLRSFLDDTLILCGDVGEIELLNRRAALAENIPPERDPGPDLPEDHLE